jgi:hypothetical protein
MLSVLTNILEHDNRDAVGATIVTYSETGDEVSTINLESLFELVFPENRPDFTSMMNVPGTSDYILFTEPDRKNHERHYSAYRYEHADESMSLYIPHIRMQYTISDSVVLITDENDEIVAYDFLADSYVKLGETSGRLTAYGNGVFVIGKTVYEFNGTELVDLGQFRSKVRLEECLVLGGNKLVFYDRDSFELFDSVEDRVIVSVAILDAGMNHVRASPRKVTDTGLNYFCIVQGSCVDVYGSDGEHKFSTSTEGDAGVMFLGRDRFCVFNSEVYVYDLNGLVWGENDIPGCVRACCHFH